MWGWTFQSLFPNPQPLGAGIGSRHLARLKSINPWQVNKCFWRWPTQKSGPETVYLRRAPFVRHVYQIAVGAERTLKSNQFWTEWRLLGDSSQRPSNILISEIYHFILFIIQCHLCKQNENRKYFKYCRVCLWHSIKVRCLPHNWDVFSQSIYYIKTILGKSTRDWLVTKYHRTK